MLPPPQGGCDHSPLTPPAHCRHTAALVCKRWAHLVGSPELAREVMVKIDLRACSAAGATLAMQPRLTSLCSWLCSGNRAAAIERFGFEANLPSLAGAAPEVAAAGAECAALARACVTALAAGGSLQQLFLGGLAFSHPEAWLGALSRLQSLAIAHAEPLRMGAWTQNLRQLTQLLIVAPRLESAAEAVLPPNLARLTLAASRGADLPVQASRLCGRHMNAIQVYEQCVRTWCSPSVLPRPPAGAAAVPAPVITHGAGAAPLPWTHPPDCSPPGGPGSQPALLVPASLPSAAIQRFGEASGAPP